MNDCFTQNMASYRLEKLLYAMASAADTGTIERRVRSGEAVGIPLHNKNWRKYGCI
jgi:hypothetical protein